MKAQVAQLTDTNTIMSQTHQQEVENINSAHQSELTEVKSTVNRLEEELAKEKDLAEELQHEVNSIRGGTADNLASETEILNQVRNLFILCPVRIFSINIRLELLNVLWCCIHLSKLYSLVEGVIPTHKNTWGCVNFLKFSVILILLKMHEIIT